QTDLKSWSNLIKLDSKRALLESNSRGSSMSGSRSSSPIPPQADNNVCFGWFCNWWCVVRLAQFMLVLIFFATLLYILLLSLSDFDNSAHTPKSHRRPPILRLNDIKEPPPMRLLDLEDFHYVHDNAKKSCDSDNIFFIFIIHSRPNHFRHRQAIRATWGGKKQLDDGWESRTIFMLGSHDGSDIQHGLLDVTDLVQQEAERHGDMVVGSFHDHYHNLTYKHVMGLRWVNRNCLQAKYVVKADDDAFINILSLQDLMYHTFGQSSAIPHNTLACHVLPEGTSPQRAGKWAVTKNEYPWNKYPPYCAGLAYLLTPHLAGHLFRAAHVPSPPAPLRIWVDDVWVTGLLAEFLQLQHHHLDLRYAYDHEEVKSWLSQARPQAAPPYTFVHLDTSDSEWRELLNQLWKHAELAHNIADKIINR
ncbi:unnamed protein product, partial [Meganyctiphanes norvegica]